MKMIESWNPVPKGSTSSPTKRSFCDQKKSEPRQKSESQESHKYDENTGSMDRV